MKFLKKIDIKLRNPKIIEFNDKLYLFGSKLNKKDGLKCQYLLFKYELSKDYDIIDNTQYQITFNDDINISNFLRNITIENDKLVLLIEDKINLGNTYKQLYYLYNTFDIVNFSKETINLGHDNFFYFGEYDKKKLCSKIEIDDEDPDFFWGKYLFYFMEENCNFLPSFDSCVSYEKDKGHVIHHVEEDKIHIIYTVLFSIRKKIKKNDYKYEIFITKTHDFKIFFDTKDVLLINNENKWHSYPCIFNFNNKKYLACNGDDFGKEKGIFFFEL